MLKPAFFTIVYGSSQLKFPVQKLISGYTLKGNSSVSRGLKLTKSNDKMYSFAWMPIKVIALRIYY